MSKFPCSLTRNITSHSKENLTFHSLLRWKVIILQILATSLIQSLFERLGEDNFWAQEWKGRVGKQGHFVAATLLTWRHVSQTVDSFCHARNICGGHNNVSENLQEHFLCPRGAQQCCCVLPRTGNIVGRNRAVYTRENKPRITQSAAYLSRELSHLYEHGLYKKLVRGLRKPRTSFLCRLYEQFAAYISRGLCNPRLIFPRINGPNVSSICRGLTPRPNGCNMLHATLLDHVAACWAGLAKRTQNCATWWPNARNNNVASVWPGL